MMTGLGFHGGVSSRHWRSRCCLKQNSPDGSFRGQSEWFRVHQPAQWLTCQFRQMAWPWGYFVVEGVVIAMA